MNLISFLLLQKVSPRYFLHTNNKVAWTQPEDVSESLWEGFIMFTENCVFVSVCFSFEGNFVVDVGKVSCGV